MAGDPSERDDQQPAGFGSPDGCMVMPGPLYHNGPFTSAFQGLMQGSSLVLMPRFDAEETLRLIDRYGVTWVYLVPAMMGRIWRLPTEVRESYDLSSLTRCTVGGQTLPAAKSLEFTERTGVPVFELWGMTEVTGAATCIRDPRATERP